MHCNEDTLVARKSLWNAGRKQENPIVFVSLDGIEWRVREAHDVETKKKLISPFNRLCHQPSTRLPTQIYDLAAASPASPVRARFSFPLPRQILSMSTVIVNYAFWNPGGECPTNPESTSLTSDSRPHQHPYPSPSPQVPKFPKWIHPTPPSRPHDRSCRRQVASPA